MLPGIGAAILAGAVGLDQVEMTFLGSDTDDTNIASGSTYNLSGFGITSAHAGLLAVVCVVTQGVDASDHPASVTVGGAAATMVASHTADNNTTATIWAATLGGSPSDTVDVEVSGGQHANCGASVHVLDGANATPISTDGDNSANGTSLAGTVNVVRGGVVIAAFGARTSGGASGDNGLTERVDTAPGADGGTVWVGDKEIAVTASGETFTVTFGGSSTVLVLAIASFEPE